MPATCFLGRARFESGDATPKVQLERKRMGRADEDSYRSAASADAGQWLLPAQQARTALNAIRGFTELLLTGGTGPLSAESLDHLRQIAAAGVRWRMRCG